MCNAETEKKTRIKNAERNTRLQRLTTRLAARSLARSFVRSIDRDQKLPDLRFGLLAAPAAACLAPYDASADLWLSASAS